MYFTRFGNLSKYAIWPKKNTLNKGYEIKCTYKSVMPTSLEISWAVYLLFRWLLRFLHCLFESEVGQFSLHLRQTLCQSDIPFSNYELTLKNFPNSVKLCICEWPCFVRTFIWFQIHFFNIHHFSRPVSNLFLQPFTPFEWYRKELFSVLSSTTSYKTLLRYATIHITYQTYLVCL